jgi:hypothetical protein
MVLDLLDPDQLVRGTDQDPALDPDLSSGSGAESGSVCFWTSWIWIR